MAQLLTLEDFTTTAPPGATTPNSAIPEADRLSAYEEGYKAGWDDAVAQQAQSENHMSEELARHLSDLSFGYHEARAHVLESVAPLLTLLAEKLLPEAARDMFATTVIEAAQAWATEAANAPVSIVTSPENAGAVAALVPADCSIPITIREDASLAPGQAFFTTGGAEHSIDLNTVETAVQSAVSGFLDPDTTGNYAYG